MTAGDDLSCLTEVERNAIVRHQPNHLSEYYLTRIAKWCRDQWQLDTRFTPLTLSLDQDDTAQGQRLTSIDGKFTDLSEILAAQPNHLAFVLLGSPGAGKSTLLQHLEWHTAFTAMHSGVTDALIPFFVSLNQYQAQADSTGELPPSPWAWLTIQWQRLNPGLADFETQMQTGRVLLLLDALNEMPHRDETHYQTLLRAWCDLLREINTHFPGNRVIFSCRELNYSMGLSSSDELSVPHIRIESLDDSQILSFLQKYHHEQAEALFRQLEQQQQLEYYRTPYFLRLLIGQVDEAGDLPKGRAALFTGFVRQVLIRELEKTNTLLQDDTLLTARERTKLSTKRWGNPYQLPEQGILCPQLQTLAFKMQQQLSGEESAQVMIDFNQALTLLNTKNKSVVNAAMALGLLDESELLSNNKVKYSHQLFQEYFAARQLATQPQPQTVASAWLQGELKPTLEETLASIADYEPLPPPPSSPWYETTLIAAPMAISPEDFIRQIMGVNLPLAGRCAAQPDMDLAPSLVEELHQQLLQRLQNTKADLRARIAAGKALGELGNPRLIRHQGQNTDEGPKQQWRENRQYYQTYPDVIRSLLNDGKITSKQAEDREAIANMSDDKFESLLNNWFPGGQFRQPDQWLDSSFNNPVQPVVGISWFEA